MEPNVKRRCLGLVLAGGASRRMGSRKEWLELDGEPLLLRTVRSLLRVAEEVAVVTDARQAYPFLPPGVWLLRDEEPDCGPVGGICTGMRRQSAELLLVTGCDYPLMLPELWRRLIARMEAGGCPDAIVPRAHGRLHPLCAVYHRRTLPLWSAALAERELRVMRVLDRMRWVAYEAEGAEADAFLNMNTPEEFMAVRKRFDPGGGWRGE